ncbi:MAG: accessory gene regulator B family protein [Hungatella sp.]|jgi:accessory gene regulator B|nr:accessory gene regulator B family protein [Hungatella sp.]
MEKVFINWIIGMVDIGEYDEEVIAYGLIQGATALLGIVIALLMGAKLGIFLQSCIFMISFIPLRMYAGGYHASTKCRCAVISFILLLIFFLGIKYWNISGLNTLLLGITESILLFVQIPVDGTCALEPMEKIVYKNRGRKILFIETIFFVGMSILKYDFLAEPMAAVFTLVLVLLFLGKIKSWHMRR